VAHFSGHGADAGIALHDANDKVRLLSNQELGKVLAAAPKRLKLAVFNSCNSAEQARVAVEHVDAAVGMQQTIGDSTARVLAGQLYNSLGFGRSLGLACTQALLQVELTFNTVSGDPTLVVAEGPLAAWSTCSRASTEPGSDDPGDPGIQGGDPATVVDASTEPGSDDPGDHVPLAAWSTCSWASTEPGSDDPGDYELCAGSSSPIQSLQRSRGLTTPEIPRVGAAGCACRRRFNGAGV